VQFLLELDSECKFIKSIRAIKEIMFLAAVFAAWIGGDSACLKPMQVSLFWETKVCWFPGLAISNDKI